MLFLDLHSRHRLHLHHIRTPLILQLSPSGRDLAPLSRCRSCRVVAENIVHELSAGFHRRLIMATESVVEIQEDIMDDKTKLLTEARDKVWTLQCLYSNTHEADLVLI